ncbi:hypothetical protein ACF1AU_33620 [Streptomyces rubrogriseus]|uniref:hypothetical protein n=1 Tax=Streptomyces rubrogriseus TaxID=194673 RepID=UPI0036F84A1D
MATRWSLTSDCANPASLAAFWAPAPGCAEKPAPPGFGSREERFAHHEVPEDEWDDGAYLSDPEGNEFCLV